MRKVSCGATDRSAAARKPNLKGLQSELYGYAPFGHSRSLASELIFREGTRREEKIWLLSFMPDDLGFFDREIGRVECADNPFEARVLPMPSE